MRLQALFVAALLGVCVLVGVVVGALAGWPAALGWAVVATALLVAGARRARRATAAATEGRSCSCCTTTVHDPVRVV